ncbi:MAG: CBS domain-containing protein [Gammaproteobacteria bacterium]
MTTNYTSLRMSDVMSPSPVYVEINATLAEAERMMATHQIHHLPVMKDNCLESFISKRDIGQLTLSGHQYDKREELRVADIYPTQAYVADIDDPLVRVLDIMVSKRISAVIVLKEGELCGIFTEADGCRVLAQLMAAPPQ